jgi:hypothetical protein
MSSNPTKKSGKGASRQSSQRLANVRREAQRFKRAAAEVTDAAVELWSARVDLALSSGDEETARQLLLNPVEAFKAPGGGAGGAGTAGRATAGAAAAKGEETMIYDTNTNCGC